MKKRFYILKIFSTLFTASYNKVLNKHQNNSFAKLGHCFFAQQYSRVLLIDINLLYPQLQFEYWI
mgnify:CR=1 FL=1